MPRISAEARGALSYRSGSRPPVPPKALSPEAAALWRAIVRAKPLGWFDAGSLPLLARYCRTAARAEQVADELDRTDVEHEDAADLEKRVIKLNGSLTTLATKLRLSVQGSVDRKSRLLDEDGAGGKADDKLLGGNAVWQRGKRLRSVK